MTAADSEKSAIPEVAVTSTTTDDLKRRYLEALDRKRASDSATASGHGADRSTTPSSNDKVKRTFRRRAGG